MTLAGRPTVFWHIGAPKTGTTYLQSMLFHHRAALRDAGLLYPGTQQAHFWASQDLRGSRFHGLADPHVPGSWDRLVGELRRWPGTALVDHESFGTASKRVIDRGLHDLDFADVHIVLTVRDLARQLPAVWQERVKNGYTASFAEFLDAVRAERGSRPPGGRQFWADQDAPAVLARWSRTLPPDRVHVVVVPPPGSERRLLWQRFAGLLGLDPEAYGSAPPRANTSLGAAEVAVLRRFNMAVADHDVPWPVYASVFKHHLAPALAQRDSAPIEVPEEHYDWVLHWSQRAVARLAGAGYDIVGELAELVPQQRPTGLDPDAVPGDAQADAAIAGLISLVSLAASSPRATAAVRRSRRGPLVRRVEDLTARVGWLSTLRNAYRRRR